MLTSSVTTEMITFFVSWVRDTSLSVWPEIIVTDCNQVQIVALEIVYPQSWIYLCMWHVLHTIWTHFVTSQFQGLWEKIKYLVVTEDLLMFFDIWDEISSNPLAPKSIVKYLQTEWLLVLHMWSGTARKNQSIFVEGNTNMLIEAYVVYFFAEITS